MSSEGSRTTSSSRLSQFGLYRTIDARTEEFLRLSRKRQIRQGCACAAVSTAITVTVVVTVLLVYEYSINLESSSDQKPIRKPNWMSLFNDSSPFDAKYNKAKLNIDPATLKLLPIILKALNHNRYLEKLIEDSSSSPIFDKKDTTEFAYQKNVFSDAKNWMKVPTPKIYTIEYKSSPVGYFRNPKKNLEYYMKNRKIRDYQRVVNYFDKMINDKVAASSVPIQYEMQTEKPPLKETTISIDILKKLTQYKDQSTTVTPNVPSKVYTSCRCPKNLGVLLNKLLSTIQELLPEIMIAKSPCHNTEGVTTTQNPKKKVMPKLFTSKNIINTTPHIVNKVTKIPAKKPVSTEVIKHYTTDRTNYYLHKKNKTSLSKNIDLQNKFLSNILRPVFGKKFDNHFKDTNKYFERTTVKLYIDAPNNYEYSSISVTEPMKKFSLYDFKNFAPVTKANNFLDKITDVNTKQEKQIPTFKENDYNYVLPSTGNENDRLSEFDITDLEPITDKYSPENMEPKIERTTNSAAVNIKDLKLFTLRKMGDLIVPSKLDNIQIIKTTTPTTTEHPIIQINLSQTNQTNAIKIETFTKQLQKGNSSKLNNETTIPIKGEINQNITLIEENSTNTNILNYQMGISEDEDNRIPIEEDIQEQEIMKQIDSFIKNPPENKYLRKPKPLPTGSSLRTIAPKNKEEPKMSKSMLPQSRPTYLEINRNGWKHSENQDYDTNINLNMFDVA